MNMRERIARAFEGVRIFTRYNDFLDPPVWEACRYGREGEEEIVVLATGIRAEDLANVEREARVDAVLDTLREPTPEMEDAYDACASSDDWDGLHTGAWQAAFDAAKAGR